MNAMQISDAVLCCSSALWGGGGGGRAQTGRPTGFLGGNGGKRGVKKGGVKKIAFFLC